MKMPTKILLTLVTAAALSYATPAFANLVSNPGFETGDFTDWTQFGNTGFTGVDTFSARFGTFGAFFGPVGSDGGISQNLTTVAGQHYTLSFWLENDGGTPNDVSILWNGATIASGVDLGGFGYTRFSFSGLVATSGSTQLAFSFRQDPAYYRLDNVSVTAPDGGNTLWLLGLAMVGICLVRRLAPARVR